jgi:predicted porin
VRGELFLDRWQVPNLSTDPRDVSWYIESSYDVTAGLFVATRWNEIRFNRLPFNGLAEAWVYDVRRIQLGAGYRFVQNAGVRAEYVVNRTRHVDPRDDLFAVQWWWAF